MDYRQKRINREIDRISRNGAYTLKETQEILIKILEEIEDTGELIRLFGIYKISKNKESEE